MEFFYSLLRTSTCSRLGQLRVINPSRPNLSVRYNPFTVAMTLHAGGQYGVRIFNLHDEFFGNTS